MKHYFTFIARIFFLISLLTFAGNGVFARQGIGTVTEEGAWCWFADPRAVSYKSPDGSIDRTYIGYIDVHGNIKAAQIDHITGTFNEVLVRSYFQPDDHDNPTFLVLPDGRIMIFYCRHTDEACFYYRISEEPGDITKLGTEFRLETDHNTTYPSPFILSNDPDHIYLCWRGLQWHPTIARLAIPDETRRTAFDWGPRQIVRYSRDGQMPVGGSRPYAKYASDGKGKIYLAYTTTHPDNENPNWVYFNYIDIPSSGNPRDITLTDVKGNIISRIDSQVHIIDKTEEYARANPFAVVDSPSEFRDWIWEVTMDASGNPAIAVTRISDDKESHDYYYARWNGEQWQMTFLANAGGHFHQTPNLEKCYSGGMALDRTAPGIIYSSVPVEGINGRVYEIVKFTVDGNGILTSSEPVTSGSEKNNIRPYVISQRNGTSRIAWMYGDYYDWIVSRIRPQGYPTAIRTDMPLPPQAILPASEPVIDVNPGRMTPHKKIDVAIQPAQEYTIVMNLSIDHEFYEGEIMNTGKWYYGIDNGNRPLPYFYFYNGNYISTGMNPLGTSDGWKSAARGTTGEWYPVEKLGVFQLAVTYKNDTIFTYIDGLIDQHIGIPGQILVEISFGGFSGTIYNVKIFDRALTQTEIRGLKL